MPAGSDEATTSVEPLLPFAGCGAAGVLGAGVLGAGALGAGTLGAGVGATGVLGAGDWCDGGRETCGADGPTDAVGVRRVVPVAPPPVTGRASTTGPAVARPSGESRTVPSVVRAGASTCAAVSGGGGAAGSCTGAPSWPGGGEIQ